MKAIIYDAEPCGGSTRQLEAEISDDVLKDLCVRKAFERFARTLAEQYAGSVTSSNCAPIIGVDLQSVNFSLIMGAPLLCITCKTPKHKHWTRDHEFKPAPGPKRRHA